MPERRIGITKYSPITLVELPATFGGSLDGDVAVDIYSRLRFPPRALPLLEAVLRQDGYQDVVSIAPLFNPGSKMTKGDWTRIFGSPVLGLSAITRTINQTAELARAYHEVKPDGLVILGGVHGSALPEECLEWADIVVRKEGERTFSEAMKALEENGSPKGVKGVSYNEGDTVVHGPDRPLLSEKELAELPEPVYSDSVRKGIKWNVAWTGRGCTGRCDFCYTPIAYGECYRRKPNESNITQLKALPPGPTFFTDDYFLAKPQQTKNMLRMMKEEGLNRNVYMSQLRAQAGLIPEAPQLLWDAGMRIAAIGFESQNDDTLKEIGKTTTAAQNLAGARALRAAGIRILGMFMVGLDHDTPESVRESLEFAKAECDYAQFFAVGPVPGTKFAAAMAEQGRILTKDYSLYDGQHVLIRPVRFSPYELQQETIDMTREFYSLDPLMERVRKTVFGWLPDNHHVSPYRSLQEFTYDIMIRSHARQAVKTFVNNPRTQRHLAMLKAIS